MNPRKLQTERLAWIAAVAVLATSLAWLTAIDVLLVASAHTGGLPALRLVLRALLKAAWAIAQNGLTAPALTGFAAALVAVITVATLGARALRGTLLKAERGS